MNYKKEVLNYVNTHPGCRAYDIWESLNTMANNKYDKKNVLGKFVADITLNGRYASLRHVFKALDDLRNINLIRRETTTESGNHDKVSYIPSGLIK